MAAKTIIITALPSKQGTVAIQRPQLHSVRVEPRAVAKRVVMEATAAGVVPRKRERLTHLSAEEKLNRRKLKNRIAAQTARDRKKARMMGLEVATEEMQTENETLRLENEELLQANAQLEAEKEALELELAQTKARLAQEMADDGRTRDPAATFGSAASISAPQQREQVAAAGSGTTLLTLLTTLLTLSSPSSSTEHRLSLLSSQTTLQLEEMAATLRKGHPLSQPQLSLLAHIWRRSRKKEPPPSQP